VFRVQVSCVTGPLEPILVKGEFAMCKFECCNCGCSDELVYEKWVNCKQKVVFHEDGHIEYGTSLIDEGNELGAVSYYKCDACGNALRIFGSQVDNESDLKHYLKMSPDEIAATNQEHYNELEEQVDDIDFVDEAALHDVV